MGQYLRFLVVLDEVNSEPGLHNFRFRLVTLVHHIDCFKICHVVEQYFPPFICYQVEMFQVPLAEQSEMLSDEI